MTSPHSLRLLAIASASLLATGAALAQADSYSYFGLSAGQSRSNMNTQTTVDQLLGAGVSTGLKSNLRDTGYKVFGGYQFNPYFGMELGYFDLGHFNFDATTAGGTLGGRYKMKGVDFDLVGTMPLSESWGASARMGVQDAQTTANFTPTGSVALTDLNRSKHDVNVKYGVGLQYAFSRSFMVRAELERFRVNDAVGNHAGVNLVSVGLVFPFGRTPLRARQATAAPYVAPSVAPVAAAVPAPAPVAVLAAPEPVAVIVPSKRRVSYSVESLFTFDESALRPEGQVALDSFARELSGSSYQVITVEGHTDRLGSDEYNQSLSMRRAEKVKSYLVTSGGLMPDKITVVGMSESQPVTTDCVGKSATAQLKACLQADRRVEIEVVGTR